MAEISESVLNFLKGYVYSIYNTSNVCKQAYGKCLIVANLLLIYRNTEFYHIHSLGQN